MGEIVQPSGVHVVAGEVTGGHHVRNRQSMIRRKTVERIREHLKEDSQLGVRCLSWYVIYGGRLASKGRFGGPSSEISAAGWRRNVTEVQVCVVYLGFGE